MSDLAIRRLTVAEVAPAGLTFVLIMWTAALAAISYLGHPWTVYPAVAVLPVTVLLHLALIFIKRPRGRFVIYALIHIPFQLFIWASCLMLLSSDSL
jgi:membrane protease YdiL (CAAX protease family)